MAPRGGGAKSGGALPKLHIWCPKTAFFGPKRPRYPVKTDKPRETVATLHVRLDCPVTKSSLLPSNSTICPRNGPKMAKNGLNVRYLCQTGPTQKTDRILIYTPLPNSRLLHHTAPRYVRRVQLDAYLWRKGLNSVKRAQNGLISLVYAPRMVHGHFGEKVFLPHS